MHYAFKEKFLHKIFPIYKKRYLFVEFVKKTQTNTDKVFVWMMSAVTMNKCYGMTARRHKN